MSDQLIGQELEAYCGKCKDNTVHLVTAATDEKITKVMCKICNSYHQYRKPKHSESKSESETAKIKTKPRKTRARRDKWTRILNNAAPENAIEYQIGESYEIENAINHPKFGLGIVKNVIDSRKIEVLFEDGERILAQNTRRPGE